MTLIVLEPSAYGTDSLRRTKAAEIHQKTGNLRAVQILLGYTKVDRTVRYLGVELDDTLSIAERIDICPHVGGRPSPFADSEQTYDLAAAKAKCEPNVHKASCYADDQRVRLTAAASQRSQFNNSLMQASKNKEVSLVHARVM